MTVICYSRRHKILAADSRCSDEHSMHLTNTKKIYRLANKAIVGTAGDDDCRDVLAVLSTATPNKMPSKTKLAETRTDFMGIIVFPKGHIYVIDIRFLEHANEGEWSAQCSPITDDFVAVGHGQQYAYGALEAGKSPMEAVRITCRRDTTCSLPVQWESLDGQQNDN